MVQAVDLEARAWASSTQDYESNVLLLRVDKTLALEREGDRWNLTTERVPQPPVGWSGDRQQLGAERDRRPGTRGADSTRGCRPTR